MHTFNLPYFKTLLFGLIVLDLTIPRCFLIAVLAIKKQSDKSVRHYFSNPFIKLTDLGTKTSIQKDGVDFLSDESFISIVDIMSEDLRKF